MQTSNIRWHGVASEASNVEVVTSRGSIKANRLPSLVEDRRYHGNIWKLTMVRHEWCMDAEMEMYTWQVGATRLGVVRDENVSRS